MKKVENKNELSILIGFSFVALLFWDSIIVYPIKFFIVLIHEINHGLMAILTGGSIHSIIITSNLSGITNTIQGNAIFIASAGYLGSLVWGLLLVISANKEKLQLYLCTIISTIIFIVAVNIIEDGFFTFLSIVFSLIFFILPRYVNKKITPYILKFLGIVSCFYVIADIKQDLLTSSIRETDTQILEYLTGLPAILIGLLWFIISIALLFLVLKQSYFSKN